MAEETFEGWAVVELMGHRQRAGLCRSVELFGGKLLRIDIPLPKPQDGTPAPENHYVTEYYGASAIYALRPATEEMIRADLDEYGRDPRPSRPLDYKPPDALTSQFREEF